MKKPSKTRTRDIHKKMSFSELLEKHPEVAEELFSAGMHCAHCPAASFETIEEGAMAHGLNPNKIMQKLNKKIKKKNSKKKTKIKKKKK